MPRAQVIVEPFALHEASKEANGFADDSALVSAMIDDDEPEVIGVGTFFKVETLAGQAMAG